MAVNGSTVVRRQLGRRLRRLREDAGKTAADVQAAKLTSAAKLWRIEGGKTPVKVPDIRALCWLYGADEQTTNALATLAPGTNDQGWWEDYSDVMPAWFGLYIGLEAAADELRLYEAELVPGIFQTADYAREIYRAAQPELARKAIERQVALRLERQQTVLGRTPPAQITAVLNDIVIRRPVGGPAVLAAQLHHLRELAQLDHVDIRVLPLDAGAHAAMTGAFQLLDFDDPDDPPVVYAETLAGARYVEQPSQLDEYRRVFNLIYKQTTGIEEYLLVPRNLSVPVEAP